MISYPVYKVVHLTGIALILLGLGAVLGAYANADAKAISSRFRLTGFLTHGIGMLLALTGGFGMAARLGMVNGLPPWIYGKLVIWLLLGLGISLAKRRAKHSLGLIAFFAFLVAFAAYIAIWKPGPTTPPPTSAVEPTTNTQ